MHALRPVYLNGCCQDESIVTLSVNLQEHKEVAIVIYMFLELADLLEGRIRSDKAKKIFEGKRYDCKIVVIH